MADEYIQLGPIEYRPAHSEEPLVRALRLRGGHSCMYLWRQASSRIDAPVCGVGHLVRARDRSVVNFLKIRPIADSLEESLLSGYPIAKCKVIFGGKTEEILVAVDSTTALALHLASGLGTVAVLYGDNLIDECKHLQRLYPDNLFKLCINDTGQDEHSQALSDAQEAAHAIGAVIVTSGACSFAELYRAEGSEEVRKRLAEPCRTHTWGPNRGGAFKPLRIPPPAIPWPHGFDGHNLLDNLVAAIRRYVVISDHMALIVSLWVIHTHVIETARFSPLLAILSPERATGKSTLLTVLSRLCRRAYKTAQISPGHLLRMIKKYQPTMLLEDADAMFRSQPFLIILNSSHDRSHGGITTAAKKDEFESMGTFFAKATKSHVGLPESIKHRSIPIQLQRRRPEENILPVAAYSPDVNDELTAVHAQLVRWAQDHRSDPKMTVPTSRNLGYDRINDTFSPLMAIAEIIGGNVIDRVEAAARQLLTHDDVTSEGVALLDNIREILMERSGSKVPSGELVEALCARSDWPWSKCNKGRPLDQVLLATMLKPYGIEPERMRNGAAVKRGYWVEHLADAFAKYLRGAEQDVKDSNPTRKFGADDSAAADMHGDGMD